VAPGRAEVRAAALRGVRTAPAADAFWRLPCPGLDGTAEELVRAGRGDEVLAFLARLEQEAPARSAKDGPFAGWLGRFGGRG